ncbi:tyrosine-type recombinase/integrase [Staphylococcus haemolyticus]|uniref:tyrosine-type recombinase/integrase n=1 Tax=Staphylococcus haemolyticus TaxID=1283 RepID=UPI0015D81991|nr:site-specific integrase [Staphylococcus haemolyticus]
MVMNQKGELNEDINYFLNVVLKNSGYKTREKAYNALKLLYSYCLLFDIEVIDLTSEDVDRLIQFLYGGKIDGKFLCFDISVTRHTNTIQNYLNIYDQYYKYYSNKEYSPFRISSCFPTSNYIRFSDRSQQFKQMNNTKYITKIQFEKIINIIRNEYSIREYIIVNLMYYYGLRIGEVLGITLEDLKFDNNQFKIIIRNRLTDKPWQKSKGLLTPTSKEDYTRNSFNEIDSGFQVIYVTENTYKMFDEYIEDSRTTSQLMISQKRLQNLNERCTADKIDTALNIIENQYIFLSKNLYKPLTNAGWNVVLREIFLKAKISVDQNKKKLNLNHRFRHAFAMNLVEENVSPNQLARRMRHKSVSSSYKYYNPDEKDQFKILEQYKESLGEKYDFRL